MQVLYAVCTILCGIFTADILSARLLIEIWIYSPDVCILATDFYRLRGRAQLKTFSSLLKQFSQCKSAIKYVTYSTVECESRRVFFMISFALKLSLCPRTGIPRLQALQFLVYEPEFKAIFSGLFLFMMSY